MSDEIQKLTKENLMLSRRVINQTGELRRLHKRVEDLQETIKYLRADIEKLRKTKSLINERALNELLEENDSLMRSLAEAWEDVQKWQNEAKARRMIKKVEGNREEAIDSA